MQNLKSKNEIQVFCRQKFDLIHRNSICFGTSKSARHPNPSHSREEKKKIEIPYWTILWKIKMNYFVEEKNIQNFVILFWTNLRKVKCSKFHAEPFRKRKNTQNAFKTIKRKKKLLETRIKPFKDKETHSDYFFAEFRSVPFCSDPRNGLLRDTQNLAKGTHFSAE